MNWPALTRTLSRLQLADRPQPVASRAARDEPCIALIYGFASREHMQRHLLRFLRQSGFADLQAGEAVCLRIVDGKRGRMAMQVLSWEAATRHGG